MIYNPNISFGTIHDKKSPSAEAEGLFKFKVLSKEHYIQSLYNTSRQFGDYQMRFGNNCLSG
jgi:hypothetical protein